MTIPVLGRGAQEPETPAKTSKDPVLINPGLIDWVISDLTRATRSRDNIPPPDAVPFSPSTPHQHRRSSVRPHYPQRSQNRLYGGSQNLSRPLTMARSVPEDPRSVPCMKGVRVVIYQYCCDQDGPCEVSLPMGTAPKVVPCPRCEGNARRVFSSPMVSQVDQRAMRLIDSTKATSDRPHVVTSIPPGAGRSRQPMAPANPALRRLPRP